MSPAECQSIPGSIKELISRWPTVAEFAADLGCAYQAARKMKDRQSISPSHWPRIIDLCADKGIPGVNWEWLGREMAKNKS